MWVNCLVRVLPSRSEDELEASKAGATCKNLQKRLSLGDFAVPQVHLRVLSRQPDPFGAPAIMGMHAGVDWCEGVGTCMKSVRAESIFDGCAIRECPKSITDAQDAVEDQWFVALPIASCGCSAVLSSKTVIKCVDRPVQLESWNGRRI